MVPWDSFARTAAAPLLILTMLGLAAPFACDAPEARSAETDRRAAETREPGGQDAVLAPGTRPGAHLAEGPSLTVRETAGVARRDEVVSSGIPLPRSLGVRDISRLAVVDSSGRPVPADFRVLARWNAGLADAGASVQWLLVAFPATVPASGSAIYRLVAGGPRNPAPARPLSLQRQGNRIVVDTGAAVFTLGGDGSALFERVALPGGPALVEGGALTAAAGGATVRQARVRELTVEHAGPLTAAVVLTGAYDMEPVGKGGLGSRRRYLFTAGSPTAIVTQAVAWEGNLACQGCVVTKDGTPNGLRVERVRDRLSIRLGPGGGLVATAVGERGKPAVAGPLPAGTEAWVRQRQRPNRRAPLGFDVKVASATASGAKADGALLAASGPAGTVAVALDHMYRYEPQALRLSAGPGGSDSGGPGSPPGSNLAIDLADDHVWLAHHQALFATFAVAALPGRPAREELDRRVWAPLNHPLRPWPDPAWFTGSQAVEEIPVGRLPGRLAAYDGAVSGALARTLEAVDGEGVSGLMTFGLYPRYWGRWGSPELDCKGKGANPGRPSRAARDAGGNAREAGPAGDSEGGEEEAAEARPRNGKDDGKNRGKGKDRRQPRGAAARSAEPPGDDSVDQAAGKDRRPAGKPAQPGTNDPTPAEDWDDTFWCGTWTDYHSTSATAAAWAMRSGEVRWLDEITWPAARRLLYTQIQQCAPDDPWFYCGQSPSGYGGYRKDFNSSHAYFENLLLYYWLSGDSTVVETLRRGAESMRRQMCDLRGPVGVRAARGPAGPACPPDHPFSKATFTGRVASQWLAVFRFVGLASDDPSFLADFSGGLARGITLQYAELTRGGRRYGFLGEPLEEPGKGVAGPMWTNGFYDANNLYRLMRDTGDAPLGSPPLRPSEVLVAMARTVTEIEGGADIAGGTRRGWPRLLGFTFSGQRIGGLLTGTFVPPRENRPLYNPEKAGMAALLVRAGRQSGDRELLAAGTEVVRMAMGASAAEDLPLGKLQGQYLTRLHPSVALLAEGDARDAGDRSRR